MEEHSGGFSGIWDTVGVDVEVQVPWESLFKMSQIEYLR